VRITTKTVIAMKAAARATAHSISILLIGALPIPGADWNVV
jgi:hypothetical protein